MSYEKWCNFDVLFECGTMLAPHCIRPHLVRTGLSRFQSASGHQTPISKSIKTLAVCLNKGVANVKQGNNLPQTSFAKKAKENVKTASYGGVILAGVGVIGAVLYNLWDELFSGNSPTSLFQTASDKCMEHPKVQDMLGEPIKAFGEETRRGRRRHVSYMDYMDENGRKGVRVKFYLQGLRKKATCQVDAREDGTGGNMKTRFIIVTADDLLRTTVIVEDNR